MKYQRYVSLGDNCECAFQIRRVLGRDESSFFSWNITPLRALISLLDQSFASILKPENLRFHGDGSLVKDVSHDFYFHSDFPRDPEINFADHPDVLANHRAKAKYLIEKFHGTGEAEGPTAYFYKISNELTQEFSIDDVVSLKEKLSSLPCATPDDRLIVLQDETKRAGEWGINGISNRYLRRLAPILDATDGHVLSWDGVFREFPHASELRFAGY